jgi:hypothetical protein
MSRMQRITELYEYAEMPIQHVSIEDDLLRTFSKEVRKLNIEMRDWLDVSTDWDEALANLRRADWRLRNQPGDFTKSHPAKTHLSQGLSRLNGLYSNLGDEIRKICRSIIENGNAILRSEDSTLNSNLIALLKASKAGDANNLLLILRQEDLIGSCLELLNRESIDNVFVETGYSAIQKKHPIDKLFVVGNILDYPSSVFSSIFSKYGTTILGYSWVPEQDSVGTALSEIAMRPVNIPIIHSQTKEKTEPIDVSHFLEPSVEIASRQLRSVAKNVYAHIDRSNVDEENIQCRAHLLAGNNVVFLPTKEGAIDSIDMSAKSGSRVQRMPIKEITIGSVILLRIGKSDSDSIFEMANGIGGKEAIRYRNLQKEWKDALKMRISSLGSSLVIKQLKDLGIKNPWIGEWKSFKNNIRPENDDYFRKLLKYLAIEPESTIEAMNALRRLHLMAAMRLRKMLKEKFENANLQTIHEEGFLIEDLGESPEIAKLGAFICLSIGEDVFEVPESAVKQLQKAVD